ncbi:MAG: MFS transporter [Acholeplasmataceae bacterium]
MKLDYKKTFYVGLAFFIITIFWQTYDNIIARILIDKFGLNQTWSGAVMALDNLLAVILLPVFGALSDRSNHKRGRRTPFIIVGTVLAAFAFMFLSYADVLQTNKINETDVNNVHYGFAFNLADQITDAELESVEHWETIAELMDQERASALSDGRITQEEYDDFVAGPLATIERVIREHDSEDYFAESESAVLLESYLDYLGTDEWDNSVSHWQIVVYQMQNERADALEQEKITPNQYEEWDEDVNEPMSATIADHDGDGTFSPREFAPIKENYYTYLSTRAWEVTASDPFVLVLFMGILLAALISMSVFRSPAVALMPDTTMKPLRSKANAIINLMGSLAAIIALAILAITRADQLSYVYYTSVFILVGIIMLITLVIFLWKVKEPKLVEERIKDDLKYGITDEEDILETQEQIDLARSKRLSLYLILLSVFLWFMGYNAVVSKVADYAPKILNMGAALAVMIAHGVALIAFIPIGIISTRIGRRKSILIGIVILSLSFLSIRFLNESLGWVMYLVFGLVGIGWATINVNSYPMVVELSKGTDVGKYTGYYYTFSMAAQIVTPILSGFLMDTLSGGRLVLFPYATIFVASSFITMYFVKHGDAKIEKKGVLESFDVDMD